MPNEILYLLLGVLSLCGGLLKVTSIHTKYAVQNNRREFLRGGRMKMTLNQIMTWTPHYMCVCLLLLQNLFCMRNIIQEDIPINNRLAAKGLKNGTYQVGSMVWDCLMGWVNKRPIWQSSLSQRIRARNAFDWRVVRIDVYEMYIALSLP